MNKLILTLVIIIAVIFAYFIFNKSYEKRCENKYFEMQEAGFSGDREKELEILREYFADVDSKCFDWLLKMQSEGSI